MINYMKNKYNEDPYIVRFLKLRITMTLRVCIEEIQMLYVALQNI